MYNVTSFKIANHKFKKLGPPYKRVFHNLPREEGGSTWAIIRDCMRLHTVNITSFGLQVDCTCGYTGKAEG